MIVRYWMTEALYVVTEGMTLLDALRVMRDKSVRRLPVVHGDELRGILCLTDLYQFVDPMLIEGSRIPASISEELDSILVSQHMTTWPITCEPNDAIEEVGARMRKKKVGSMPVLQQGELVGIITESDIFEALTQLAGWGHDGLRVCLRMQNDQKKDLFFRVVGLCQKYDVELLTLLTHPLRSQEAQLVLMRIRGCHQDDLVEALWDEYQVLIAE